MRNTVSRSAVLIAGGKCPKARRRPQERGSGQQSWLTPGSETRKARPAPDTRAPFVDRLRHYIGSRAAAPGDDRLDRSAQLVRLDWLSQIRVKLLRRHVARLEGRENDDGHAAARW